MNWDKLTRAEKIAHLFDYSYPERLEKVRKLWGESATEYDERVSFPPNTPWNEIVAVIKQTGKTQYAYVTLKVGDFGVITHDDLENNCDESLALVGWRQKIMDSDRLIQLKFQLYDEKTLIARVCTERGYRGDEDGYGVEPDMWASALFDFKGNVVAPFRPGYTYK